MARQKLKSVQLPRCKHFILVPAYQSLKPEDYAQTYCSHPSHVEPKKK